MSKLSILYSLLFSFFASAAPKTVPGEYVVKYRDGKIGLITKSVTERPNKVLSDLLRRSDILIAEPNFYYEGFISANDRDYTELWGLNNRGQQGPADQPGVRGMDINAEQAWNITTGKKSTVVAVIDSGIDYTHPELADNMWINLKEKNGQTGIDDDGNGFIDDIYGYNFVNDNNDIQDPLGHGTHVAGTIGAKGNNHAGSTGVAWNISLMGVRSLSRQNRGKSISAIQSVRYATDNGADVINASWGGKFKSEILKQEIQRAGKKGIVFVAAAGNSLVDIDKYPLFPASFKLDNVITVAAANNLGRRASFSNIGRNSVHVAAPGVAIWSTKPNRRYATMSGTSMAAPHVTGVVALLKSYKPNLPANEIRQLLIKTSKPLPHFRGKIVSGGMIDAAKALRSLKPKWKVIRLLAASPHPYPKKFTRTYRIHHPQAKQIRLHFKKVSMARGDQILVLDSKRAVKAQIGNNRKPKWSKVFLGNTVLVQFSSKKRRAYGFEIDKIAVKVK